jgi:hypothetical protein
MRKMILMAIAGYVWKKFQERGMKPRVTPAPARRY